MKKLLKIILLSVIVIDILFLGIIFFANSAEKSGKKEETDDSGMFERVSVAAVGDNIITDTIFEQAYARTGSIKYDFSYSYEKIASIIEDSDIAVLSQPSVISSEHNVSGAPLFNSPTELGTEMAKIGFDVVNVASPHCLDYGEKGLINSINLWNALGVRTIGAYETKEKADSVTVMNVDSVKVAFVAFTGNCGGNSLPEDSEATIVLSEYESEILSMTTAAKSQADFVIVCCNWGEEYQSEVTEEQKQFAQKLASWGADVIIGTGTKTLLPTEYIENQDGTKTFVAYSLGCFISDEEKTENLLGGLLTFDIVKNTQTGSVSFENVDIDGVVTHYGYNKTSLRIYPLSDYTSSLAKKHGASEYNDKFSLKVLKKMVNSAE